MNWLVDADVTEPVIAPQVAASGGTETVITVGGRPYRVHTFTSNGTFTVTTAGKIECFLVGGGGAGGQTIGDFDYTDTGLGDGAVLIVTGGGGGGGVVNAELNLTSTGAYTITVGAGGQIDTTMSDGVPLTDFSVLNGGDSKIALSGTDLVVAKGGGGGGVNTYPIVVDDAFFNDGQNGASAGGGVAAMIVSDWSSDPTTVADSFVTSGGTSILNQGTDGGDAVYAPPSESTNAQIAAVLGGGGGGAFEKGEPINFTVFTDVIEPNPSGGNGLQSSFDGTLKTYGGGGGASLAGPGLNAIGKGGAGGGGNGARNTFGFTVPSSAGTNGLGGGGGGAVTLVPGEILKASAGLTGVTSNQAADGGSGVVIIRYPIEA